MSQTILIVEDDHDLREALIDTLEMAGYATLAADNGASALARIEESLPRLVLSDVHMKGMDGHALLQRLSNRWSDLPVILMTAYGSIEKAVEAMRTGAVDYLSKPFEAQTLIDTVAKYIGPPGIETDGEPIAADPRSRDLLTLAAKVANSEATVMISGESGTGKEVLARYMHRHSRRHHGPFVAINCAAIPENMLEATLFGYEKGAFTGAYKATPGKFEQANGGTLLLDEVSEMDLALQAKLLRVLQEREVERLGSNRTLPLDLRILATTNRDMAAHVRAGEFREDLYYRLNVFPLHIRPLRERPDDILPLAQQFAEQAAQSCNQPIPTITPAAADRLRQHHWPGNVRELDNLMQRAVILATDDTIDADAIHFAPLSSSEPTQESNTRTGFEPMIHTPASATPPADTPATHSANELTLGADLKSQEYRAILDALRSGSRQSAADRLGISPRTLRYKLARMREEGIELPA